MIEKSLEVNNKKVNKLERYKRHYMMKKIGNIGQEKLCNSRVLVVGAGGLGSPILLYLCAMGVNNIGIIDFDEINESNLQRQILYGSKDIGKSKAEIAKKQLLKLNPECNIVTYVVRADENNLSDIVDSYDIIVDAVDNSETRYIINKIAVCKQKKVVYGSVQEFFGQLMVYSSEESPCYECIFPKNSNNNIPPGIISPLVGVIGSLQAMQVAKMILNLKTQNGLLYYDGEEDSFIVIKTKKNPQCPICGKNNLRK